MTPLVVGIVLIVGGIAFAAAPLLRRRSREGGDEQLPGSQRATRTAGTVRADSDDALQLADAPSAVPGSIAMALEELELDRAMGKLGERDYQELRAAIVREGETAARPATSGSGSSSTAAPVDVPATDAPAKVGATDATANDVATDAATPADGGVAPPRAVAPDIAPVTRRDLDAEAERLVRAARADAVSCPDCGPRPEPGASFCSDCGRALGACPSCGARIAQDGARFCDRCGTTLTR